MYRKFIQGLSLFAIFTTHIIEGEKLETIVTLWVKTPPSMSTSNLGRHRLSFIFFFAIFTAHIIEGEKELKACVMRSCG